jgi:ABC-type sugar transport system substrate-binding protein
MMENEEQQMAKHSRRTFVKTAGAAGVVALAGCGGDGNGNGGNGNGNGNGGNGNGGNGNGDSTGNGNGGGSEELNFVVSMKAMGQAGLFVQGQAAKWYTQDMDNVNVSIVDAGFDATTQNQQTITAINQGVDGVLLNPFDARASRQIVERAQEDDIPVMNFDTATLSEDIKIGALFGQYAGGAVAAERFTQMMDEQGMDSAKVITSVFNFESTTSQQRLFGFTENVPDSVEVVSRVESDGTADGSASPTVSALQANPDVDAIYSNNVGSGMGAMTALQQQDMYYEKGNEDHVMAFGIDGGPELNQLIGDGYYDFAIDQPLHMYAPLTLELMFSELGVDPPNSGTHPDSLPTPDSMDEVTTDDLSIANKTVFGTQPWAEQFWAPAEMTTYEADDQGWWPWMKCQHATITQDNADAPYLYGNVYRQAQNN